MKTLVSLQYLRALAALSVVLVHALERRGWRFDIGQMGVDVFFVLSGFLMWLVSERCPRSPHRFFADRVVRIAPTYWLATVFVLMMWAVGVRSGLDHPDPWHALKSFLFIPAEYPGKEKIYPIVIPGWTLNYEMFFYAIFAAALAAGPKLRLLVLTAILPGLVAVGLALRPQGSIATAYTDPIMLEFLAGVWLGVMWTGTAKVGRHACSVAITAGLMMAGAFAWLAPDAPRVIAWGAPAFLIVAGAAFYERNRTLTTWPWLVLLGDASYSIYLWHVPFNPLWDHLAQMTRAPDWLAVLLVIAGGVGSGVLAYFAIERPIGRWLKGRLRRSSRAGKTDSPGPPRADQATSGA